MKLKEIRWTDQPREVEVEYPDAPIAAFIDWMRNTKAWQEDPTRLYWRFRKFEDDLLKIREARQAEEAKFVTAPVLSEPPKRTRAEIARANLAKARAAKAAKQAAGVAG